MKVCQIVSKAPFFSAVLRRRRILLRMRLTFALIYAKISWYGWRTEFHSEIYKFSGGDSVQDNCHVQRKISLREKREIDSRYCSIIFEFSSGGALTLTVKCYRVDCIDPESVLLFNQQFFPRATDKFLWVAACDKVAINRSFVERKKNVQEE